MGNQRRHQNRDDDRGGHRYRLSLLAECTLAAVIRGGQLLIPHGDLAPQPGDVLLPKKHPSAFFGTPLASYLINLGVDTLVVTGCTTSGCVRGSVVDAFAYNFRALVPWDAVYDRSKVSHAVNLFDMSEKYTDVMSTADALGRLERLPVRAREEANGASPVASAAR